MASTMELLRGGVYLIGNTLAIAVAILAGGPIFGSLTSFLSTYSYAPNNPLPATLVQWIPGFFFIFMIILEIVLIIRLAYILVNKTDYQTGGAEW